MNFFEAMREIEKGRVVLSQETSYKYKKENGELRQCAVYDSNWERAVNLDRHEINGEWAIYEEPKEEKGLWVKCHGCAPLDREYISMMHGRPFDNAKIRFEWHEAITTFMNLKCHPLAVKAVHDANQIFLDIQHYVITVDNYSSLNNKLRYLSPMFKNTEDAQQAINDIGEDKLIKMAKVFQGIYE